MRIVRILVLVAFYGVEVIKSNVRVAIDVLTPRLLAQPAFVDVNVAGLSPMRQLLVANLITMAPGTLSLDLDVDRQTLRVHALFAPDAEAARREIEEDLVERIRRI